MASLFKQDVKVFKDTKLFKFAKSAGLLIVGTFFEKWLGLAQALMDSFSK